MVEGATSLSPCAMTVGDGDVALTMGLGTVFASSVECVDDACECGVTSGDDMNKVSDDVDGAAACSVTAEVTCRSSCSGVLCRVATMCTGLSDMAETMGVTGTVTGVV